MEAYGVECHVIESENTGGFGLIYNGNGDRTLDVLGIADPITDVPDFLAQARMVLFGPILGETGLELVQKVRQKTQAPFVLDPQGMVRRLDGSRRIVRYRNEELVRIIPYFDVVKANEHEAQVMTGIDPRQDARTAAVKLHAYGCRVAIVTLAEAGSVLYDGDNFHKISPYSTQAKDPTGAGDVYAGSFIYHYLQNGRDVFEAACFASGASSIMVEHCGPDFPMPLSQVKHRMQTVMAGSV
jgi:sugar/nucleoside kinase (ribokinase family)